MPSHPHSLPCFMRPPLPAAAGPSPSMLRRPSRSHPWLHRSPPLPPPGDGHLRGCSRSPLWLQATSLYRGDDCTCGGAAMDSSPPWLL